MDSTLTELFSEGCADIDTNREAVHFSPIGDYLTVFFKHDVAKEKRIDDLLTVYYAEETGDLVGCKIKGVQRLVERLGALGIRVDHEPISVSLFICSSIEAINDQTLKHYQLVTEKVHDIKIEPQVLRAAA